MLGLKTLFLLVADYVNIFSIKISSLLTRRVVTRSDWLPALGRHSHSSVRLMAKVKVVIFNFRLIRSS